MIQKIRVLLADDHAIVRMGLKTVLDLEPDLNVVAQTATADEAVSGCAEHKPDVLLLDLRMPGGGMEAMARIRAACPDVRVLVLTTSDLEEDIHRALAGGAAGYALKSIAPEELADAIRAVNAGARWVPEEIARKLADRDSTEVLSPRELEVLHLVVKGLTNPEIASALEISLGTAKAHVRAILAKLQVTDRTEAAAAACRRGLVE